MTVIPDGEQDPLARLVMIESYRGEQVADEIIWPALVNVLTIQDWRKESVVGDERYFRASFYRGFTQYKVDLEIEHPLGVNPHQLAEYEGNPDLSTVKLEIEEVEENSRRDKILELFRVEFIDEYDEDSYAEFDPDTQLIAKTTFWYLFNSEGHSQLGHSCEVEIVSGHVVEERWLVNGDSCPDAIQYADPELDALEEDDDSEEAQRARRLHAVFHSTDLERFEVAAEAFKVLPGLQKAVQKLRGDSAV